MMRLYLKQFHIQKIIHLWRESKLLVIPFTHLLEGYIVIQIISLYNNIVDEIEKEVMK